ncbi:MAG: TrkA C-terminal domain-containing protein [Halobacteriota archaeon]
MTQTLDEIDKRILYYLALDARRISAPDITDDLDVSAATVRNRIRQLEEREVIRGYHASIDYEKIGGKLTYLFMCDTDTPHREYFAREALEIPGVIHVREVMSGRQNLHVEAIGEDKQEITRIGRDLSNLGLEIQDEALVQRDYHHPYQPFGPDSALSATVSNLMNLQELAGDARVVDVVVSDSAVSTGTKIRELSEEGVLDDGLLIVAIERGEEVIMPNGETEIRAGDVVTVLSQGGEADDLTGLFTDRTGTDAEREVTNRDEV